MSKKIFPERVRFLIADDIRAEGQKPMIIGLLVDDFVGVVIPSEHPDPSKEAPIMLQSLAILTSFIGCKGPFESNISLYLPDGTTLMDHQKVDGGINSDQAAGKNSINFVAKFMPFSIPEFGQYKFVITLDEREYEYKFNVDRRDQ